MIRKFLIFILVLFSFSALKAEVVKKVVVEGNKRISTETIKIYGEIEINKDLSENDKRIPFCKSTYYYRRT